MPPLPLLSETATVVEEGSYARISRKPRSLFQKMIGYSAPYYNEWLEAARLNVMLIKSRTAIFLRNCLRFPLIFGSSVGDKDSPSFPQSVSVSLYQSPATKSTRGEREKKRIEHSRRIS